MDNTLTVLLRQAAREAEVDYRRIVNFCAEVLLYPDAVNLHQLIASYHKAAANYSESLKALLDQLAIETHTPEVVSEMNRLIRERMRVTSDTLNIARQMDELCRAFSDEAIRQASLVSKQARTVHSSLLFGDTTSGY